MESFSSVKSDTFWPNNEAELTLSKRIIIIFLIVDIKNIKTNKSNVKLLLVAINDKRDFGCEKHCHFVEISCK